MRDGGGGQACGWRAGNECSARAPARVLERPVDETRKQVAELDPGGARRLRQQAVRGHAGDRVDLQGDHAIAGPHEVGAGHPATAEGLVGADRDVLRAPRDVVRDARGNDLLALAGAVLRGVVKEIPLRDDLDDRQRDELVVADHCDRELGTSDELFDECPLVVLQGVRDRGRELLGLGDDRRADARAARDRLHEYGQADGLRAREVRAQSRGHDDTARDIETLRREDALGMTLSIARADASTPDPVYGMPIVSSRPWMRPSSPHVPCSARRTTSTGPALFDMPVDAGTIAFSALAMCSSRPFGRARRRRTMPPLCRSSRAWSRSDSLISGFRTMRASGSRSTVSKRSAGRLAAICAPVASEMSRSADAPPVRMPTRTFFTTPLPARPRGRDPRRTFLSPLAGNAA